MSVLSSEKSYYKVYKMFKKYREQYKAKTWLRISLLDEIVCVNFQGISIARIHTFCKELAIARL